MSLFRLIKVVVVFVLATMTQQVYAQTCSAEVTPTPAHFEFGTWSAPTVATGIIGWSSPPAGYIVVGCSVALSLNILSYGTTFNYRLVDKLELKNGTRSIAFRLSHNSSFSPAYSNPGEGANLASSTLLNLVVLGASGIQVPISLGTVPTSVWPKPGVYSGTYRVSVEGYVCTVSLAICLTSVYYGPNIVSFTASLTVPKYCQFISAPATHNMGTVSFLDSVAQSFIPLNIRCGQDEDFMIYATNGMHHDGSSRRLKLSTGTSYVRYNLYHPAPNSTTLLGNSAGTGSLTYIATGNEQTLNIPIRVVAGQATPAVGTYSDTVTFVIEY